MRVRAIALDRDGCGRMEGRGSVVIPFLYISSALIASIKFIQSGARESLSRSLSTPLIPAYGVWCKGNSCHNSIWKAPNALLFKRNGIRTKGTAQGPSPTIRILWAAITRYDWNDRLICGILLHTELTPPVPISMMLELSHILPKIANRFDRSPNCLHVVPIKHGNVERNSLWRVIVDTQSYLLKRHFITRLIGDSAFSPFEVESSVLSTLREAGCSVPTVVWQSDSDFCLLLEWRGESTLDDAAQTTPRESLKEMVITALGEFCQIEKNFADSHAEFAPYIYPLDYPTYLCQTLKDMLDRGRKTMGYLARSCGESLSSDFDELWSDFSQALQKNSVTLGVLDYNARNIVIDAGESTFVDFGSVGWDWSERRIVQFFNSLGANREDGNYLNLLNRDVIRAYASRATTYRSGSSEEDIFKQLDYHNILFYLAVVHRLLEAIAQPTKERNRALLKAWGDTEARLSRALEILVNSELSDDSTARQIRECVKKYRDATTAE